MENYFPPNERDSDGYPVDIWRLKLNNNNAIIGVLNEIPHIVQQLLDKKAEASNKVDLDAYASGLMDMYNALNI